MSNTRKNKNTLKYILKKDEKFYIMSAVAMESFSFVEAFKLGLTAHIELRNQLLIDTVEGDCYIEDTKIVDGLEASLSKFDRMFPNIRKSIIELDSTNHSRVARS